jgi:hypothetical protein
LPKLKRYLYLATKQHKKDAEREFNECVQKLLKLRNDDEVRAIIIDAKNAINSFRIP